MSHYWAWALADINGKIERKHAAWKEASKREEEERQKIILDAMAIFPKYSMQSSAKNVPVPIHVYFELK